MNRLATALQLVGYPTAIVVISRWVPVVREQRLRWFVAHEAGVGAIVLGWLLKGQARGVVVNGTWGVVAAGWYALGGRPRR